MSSTSPRPDRRDAWPLLLALGFLACATPRDEPAGAACPSWRDDVAATLAASCATCHAAPDPAGGVTLASYADVLGVATAGEPRSPLLTALAPDDATHGGLPGLDVVRDEVSRWVVDCELRYMRDPIHGAGIQDPSSTEFHGVVLGALGGDFAACATCHGDDLAGGPARSSCLGCHVDGPRACTTCHGSPPASGAHLAHARSPVQARPVACGTCHRVPTRYEDAGHVLDDASDGADVTLVAAAGARARWDATSRTCADVGCHGGARPRWDGGAAEATCGTCHGLPPASHGAASVCATCHPRGDRHLDGVVDLGDGEGVGCGACHGTTAGGFRGPRAGAHEAHVTGRHRLAAPIACATCHRVPETTTSPGHVDSDLPAEVTIAWDAVTDTCAGTCHGAGSPSWSSPPGSGLVYCGSCHGLPPAGPAHLASWGLDVCVTCHAETVDRFGNILVVAGTSAHVNGIADHEP